MNLCVDFLTINDHVFFKKWIRYTNYNFSIINYNDETNLYYNCDLNKYIKNSISDNEIYCIEDDLKNTYTHEIIIYTYYVSSSSST